MRILVTGAAGFVGSRLSKTLLARGDEVIGLDNFNDYYPIRHKRRNIADLTPSPRFTLIEGDLRDGALLRRLFEEERPDAVAHLAAMAAVRYSVKHPLIYGEVNVQGSMNLLDAARHIGQPRLILASTGSVYGADTPVPFTEEAPADRALAPYPASKRAMEIIAHSYHHLWGAPTTILRFFNVYGPHGRPDMMPWHWTKSLLRAEPLTLFNGGRLQRDWTYIDDIVRGFLAALDAGLEYEIINLGCSRPVYNLHFVRTLEQLLDREARIVDAPTPPSEPLITYADTGKAARLLGYRPTVPVEEGLARFIEWFRAEGLDRSELGDSEQISKLQSLP
ncbi:MAG: NAD-dependent epimerase/dehydratase family protein [Ardenticatenaceae bacterium]|nr:NAD-dependent epimerase/dehydratase family protein [Ardenticatenaceae bacterium]HBY92479.1 epimerase [Chloroflexota bacterium]